MDFREPPAPFNGRNSLTDHKKKTSDILLRLSATSILQNHKIGQSIVLRIGLVSIFMFSEEVTLVFPDFACQDQRCKPRFCPEHAKNVS